MKKNSLLGCAVIGFLLIINTCFAIGQNERLPDGKYLGQKLSGNNPEMFGDPWISNRDRIDFSCTINPANDELFFSVFSLDKGRPEIYRMNRNGEKWNQPVKAEFSSIHGDGESCFTPDGNRLFFTSLRPETKEDKPGNSNIWYVDKTQTGWSGPVCLGAEVNTDAREGHASVAANGNLYFHRVADAYELYFSEYKNGKYKKAVRLGPQINSGKYIQGEPAVSPDEKVLVFISFSRPDRIATEENICDLYVSFRKDNGEWSYPIILGSGLLSSGEENWPKISPDGKYLFFSSNRDAERRFPDIYWVSLDAVLKLKPESWK